MGAPRGRTRLGKAFVSVALASVLVGLAVLPLASSSSTSDSNSSWPMLMGDAARTGGRGTVAGPGTGELLWSHSTPYNVNSPPAIADGRLFLAYGEWEEGGGILALNARSGDVLWSRETDSVAGSPAVRDNSVVVGTHAHHETGSLLAFDAASGNPLWSHQFPKTYVAGTPAIHENGLIFSRDGKFDEDEGGIKAFALSSGGNLWSYAAKWGGDNPALVGDVLVWTASYEGAVYALDARSGDLLWKTVIAPDEGLGTPSVFNGVVVIPTELSGVIAIDFETGEQMWSYDVPIAVSNTLPISDGVVVVPSLRQLHLVDIYSGEKIRTLPAPTINDVAIHQGTIYSAANTSPSGYDYDERLWFVIAMDLETGQEYWRYQLGNYTYTPPVVVDGILYQAYGDWEQPGGVVALDVGYLAAVASGTLPTEGVENTGNSSPDSGRLSPTPVSLIILAVGLAALHRLGRME